MLPLIPVLPKENGFVIKSELLQLLGGKERFMRGSSFYASTPAGVCKMFSEHFEDMIGLRVGDFVWRSEKEGFMCHWTDHDRNVFAVRIKYEFMEKVEILHNLFGYAGL